MKVLIISTSDIRGGAARAAYRLHKALLSIGIDSYMLVQAKKSDDYTVIGPTTKIQKASSIIKPSLDALPLYRYRNRQKVPFSINWVPTSKRILKKINEINPDIVHLHWVNGGMIRIEDLKKIKKIMVWSLHDMWTFTGGCHYDGGCGKYVENCGKCPLLSSNKERDLSRKIFIRKQKVFNKIIDNITIVGLSKWLERIAKRSTLLKNIRVVNLPNPIDTNIFKPINKKIAKQILNFPINKKLVLYGAVKSTSDTRKGFNQLSEALNKLDSDNIEFIVFGSSQPENAPKFKYKTHYLGYIYDDITLRILYSAADVMVVPSLQENLSNAIMESLSCGIPVVSFDVGGNRDMIDHKINGYLAKPYDTTDLAKGIEWVINNKDYDKLCQNAREKVVKNFDSIVVAKKYKTLYEEILNRK